MKLKSKSLTSSAVAFLVLFCLTLNVSAQEKSYGWFCTHRKDHLQPIADNSLSLIDRYNAFYIDADHGDECEEKVIYLTFDAGYENGNIEKTLDILKQESVTGAFFILGNLLTKNTQLVQRMFDEGHLVCNHTYSHKTMAGISREDFCRELQKLEYKCMELTGNCIAKYYRPPEGVFDERSLQYAKELGYKTVFWSFAYADWDNEKQISEQKAKEKILQNVHNGEIMLLHPTSDTNVKILRDVIRELKHQGYRFASLDELK